MMERATGEPRDRGGENSERGLGPAFAWAAGGGAAVLAVALLLYALVASLGEWLAGEPPRAAMRLASAEAYQGLVVLFLATSGILFVGRKLGVGTR